MRVYRVEHKRRAHGPWCDPNKDSGQGPATTMQGLGRFFPLPCMHCWTDKRGNYRNGVRTLHQLTMWFSEPVRRELHKLGYVVRVFETDNIFDQDEHQLMFWRPKYTHSVATHSLLDIENTED